MEGLSRFRQPVRMGLGLTARPSDVQCSFWSHVVELTLELPWEDPVLSSRTLTRLLPVAIYPVPTDLC